MSESEKQQRLKMGSDLGPYTINRLIGEGGMGEVYKAYDKTLNRHIALKTISGKLSNNSEIVKRFISEGQTLAKLNHQNVVTVYTQGEENGTYYIAMEYVEGKSLDQYSSGKTLSAKEVTSIIKQILEGVKALHECGIIHRDLKPKNIIVRSNSSVKIVDFGIAKSNANRDMDLTSTGVLVGSVYYVAPELASGDAASIQSDLWSVGVIFYELLIGRRPFIGESQFTILEKIKNEDLKFPDGKSLQVPSQLRLVIEKMLGKDKHSRYSSANEILNDLKKIENNQQIENRNAEETIPLIRTDRKKDKNIDETRFFENQRSSIWLILDKSKVFIFLFLTIIAVWKFTSVLLNEETQTTQSSSAVAPTEQTAQIDFVNFVLQTPKQNDEIWTSPASNIEFSWTPKHQEGAILQVSTEQNFSTIDFEKENVASPLQVNTLNLDKTYYWRILNNKKELLSNIMFFRLVSTAAPEINYPFDQTIFDLGHSVNIQWRPKWQAEKYRLQIAKDQEFKNLIKNTLSSSVSSEEIGLPVGKYFWRVRAENGQNRVSIWSQTLSFQIKPRSLAFETRSESTPVSINMKTILSKPVRNPKIIEKEFSKNVVKNSKSTGRVPDNKKATLPGSKNSTAKPSFASANSSPTKNRNTASLESSLSQEDILEAPKLRTPTKGASIVASNDNKSSIAFGWSKVNGAQSYTIELSTDERFSRILHQFNTTENKLDLNLNLPKGRFFWRLKVENKKGKSNWTSPSYFEIETRN